MIEHISAGGMGSVYLVREQAAERLVAMKFLHASSNSTALERFLVELRSLAKLDHPHIVRVHSSDFFRADPFFTMEYMPGGSLLRTMEPGGPLPPAEALRLIRPVADAVSAAHAAGVIHRDLKPSNILLTADGTPKVSDFSLAKRLDRDDNVTLGTGALGTPSYMPPEQISKKNGELGKWSDVYGLGATLYHLLTGRAPFVGATPEEIILKVLADPPSRPRALRPEIPLALEAVVVKCLEKDPKDRYQSVAEFLADLGKYEAGLQTDAPPLTRSRRVKRWAHRNRRRIAASALAVVLLTGVGIALTLAIQEWRKPVEPHERMKKQLAARRPVTLIGETGLPPYYSRSILEPTLLGESPLGDGTCSFHAFRYTLIELCDDPMNDHYRVELELRRHGKTEADWLGFYFGYGPAPTDPAVGHLMFAVKFKDYPPPVVPGRKPDPTAVYFQTLDFIQTPGKLSEPAPSKLRALPFAHSPVNQPGIWRPMAIEVSPTRVLVQWRSDDGKSWLTVVDWTREQIDAAYERRKEIMEEKSVGSKNLPRWAPRMPFGLVAFKSAVSVRNMVVTPLP